MTRQELEDRLLDYLYDELEAGERSAFERSLAAHPEVLREVEAHRATRKAFEALPRAAVPAGLLDGVMAEAEREAARVQAAKTAKAGAEERREASGFVAWIKRLLFQPAFAMAMVVLVVAGVSLVASDKGELPGTPVRSDAQHIPPVAVTSPSMRPAQAEHAGKMDEAGARPAEGEAGSGAVAARDEERAFGEGQREPAAGDAPKAPDPAMPFAMEVPETRTLAAGEDSGERGAPGGTPAEVPRVAASEPKAEAEPKRPARDKAEEARGGAVWGDGGAVTGGAEVDDEANLDLLAKTELEGSVAEPSGDARRDRNTPEVAERRQPEEPANERESQDAKPTPDATRTDGLAKVEGAPKPASRPAEDAPAKGPAKAPSAPSPKAQPAPTPKDLADGDQVEEAPAPPPEAEPERIVTSDRAAEKPARIDDDTKKKDLKPTPTLTPPAPSADKLWQTYRQQAAAGAYADALRSIEALAKVEGESARVKTARAELKKKLAESQEGQGGADKLPPDPPVQPPK